MDPAEEKHLVEIERLIKTKVLLHDAEAFEPLPAAMPVARERGERPVRAPRAARPAADQPRADQPRVERPVRSVSDRPRAERPSPSEREDAYARNPDQPLPASSERTVVRRERVVPMLLQRRPEAPGVQRAASRPQAPDASDPQEHVTA